MTAPNVKQEGRHAPFDEGGWELVKRDIRKLFRAVGGAPVALDGLTETSSPTFAGMIFPEQDPVPATVATDHIIMYAEAIKGFSFLSTLDDTGMRRKLQRDSVFVAKNTSGSSIPAHRAVYAIGSEDDVPLIAPARANSINTMPAIGVTVEAVANGAYGRVMQIGLVENANTAAFTAGDILYVSATTAGVLVKTAPLWPNIRQEIGTILAVDASVGSVQVIARSMFNEGILDHGGLLGLSDNDHPQYLLLTGGTMTGTAAIEFNASTENIASLNAGYMDYAAATAHRFAGAVYANGDVVIGSTTLTPHSRLQIHNAGTGASAHAYAYFTTGDTGSATTDGMTIGVAANAQAYITMREAAPLNIVSGGTILFSAAAASIATFAAGGVVFNEGSADMDFRIESNGQASMFRVDAGADRIGIATFAPAVTFEITGTARMNGTGAWQFNAATEYINSGAAGYIDVHWADDDKGCRFYSGANQMMAIQRESAGDSQSTRISTPGTTYFYASAQKILKVGISGLDIESDSLKLFLGAGADAQVFFDGANCIIDPDPVTGTAKVYIGATADDDIAAANYFMGTSATEYINSGAAGYIDVHWADDDKGCRFYSGANQMMAIRRESAGDSQSTRISTPGTTYFYASAQKILKVGISGLDIESDSLKLFLGAGADAQVFFDGANCIIDPDPVTGTAKVYIGATADDDIAAANYFMGTSATEYINSPANSIMAYVADGAHRFDGGMEWDTTTVTGATTLGAHHVCLVDTDTAGAGVTVTLPAVSGLTGRVYYVKNTGTSGHDVTLDGDGAETVDGDATQTITDGECLLVVCDGTEWWVI